MRAVMYDLHAEHERTHWWYTARREIVLSLLRAAIRDRAAPGPLRLLDIGCGTGGMLEHLSRLGDTVGVDPSAAALSLAEASTGVDVRRGALPDELPFTAAERFDVVTLLDVLEHVDDDAAALSRIRGIMQPAATLIVTVPAFAFLWSAHDEVNEHRRRYVRRELAGRLAAAGFHVRLVSYYNTALFLPIAAVRLARRLARSDGEAAPDTGVVPGLVNTLLHHMFAAERFALRATTLPFGVSLIAVARRD